MKKLFTLCFSVLSLMAFSQSTTVVISQAYGGGGGATGTYLNDYVELKNISGTTKDISGLQLMYGSATGQFGSSATAIFTFPASTTIAAGKYVLIQLGSAGTGGSALPVTPDFTTTNLSMSGSSGKVALTTAAFAGNSCGGATACIFPNADIIDWVAWGAAGNGTAGNGEGGTSVNNGVALTSTQGAVRKANGCTETNNNNLDFDVVTAPVPRNSATAASICTLPLTLIKFDATVVNQSASLSWATAYEINVNNFSIEKSINGVNFSSVGVVNAANNTYNKYSFTDALVAGVNYYRIKTIDKDGSYQYSKVVAVNNAKKGSKLEVYPNPAVNSLMVYHNKAAVGTVAKVLSLEGKVIATYPLQSGATTSTIDVSRLLPGNYIITVENGNDKQVSKFVKQ